MEIPQRESGEGGEGRTRPLYESKKKKRPQNTQEAEGTKRMVDFGCAEFKLSSS